MPLMLFCISAVCSLHLGHDVDAELPWAQLTTCHLTGHYSLDRCLEVLGQTTNLATCESKWLNHDICLRYALESPCITCSLPFGLLRDIRRVGPPQIYVTSRELITHLSKTIVAFLPSLHVQRRVDRIFATCPDAD